MLLNMLNDLAEAMKALDGKKTWGAHGWPIHLVISMLSLLHLSSPWTGTCHTSVWLFCFGLLCFALFWWVCFWFLFSACGDFVTVNWPMWRSYTSSLLRPLNLQTAMCMRYLPLFFSGMAERSKARSDPPARFASHHQKDSKAKLIN